MDEVGESAGSQGQDVAFPTGDGQHEGILGKNGCVFFCELLAGGRRGYSEGEPHGDDTLFVIVVASESAGASKRRWMFREAYLLPLGCVGGERVLGVWVRSV
jgi:hypothetical protein